MADRPDAPGPEPPGENGLRGDYLRPKTEPALREALLAAAQARVQAVPPARFQDISPKRLLNTSEMVPRSNLMTRLFSFLMFRKVAFEERHQNTIRELCRDGDLVMVMNRHSQLDYLYFNYAFRRFRLPLVFFCNRMSMTMFRPVWKIVVHVVRRLLGRVKRQLRDNELFAYGLSRSKPSLIFLKRNAIWPWASTKPSDTYLKTMIDTQQDRLRKCRPHQSPRPVYVVAMLLVWTQDPDRYERRLGSLVFGNPAAPGRLRKLINFLLNRRRAFVQMSKPINLVEFLAEQPPELNLNQLARRLRFTILQSLHEEERIIKGPVLKRARRIAEEIVRTRDCQDAIADLAAKGGTSTGHVEKQMVRYIKEIAADFSISYIELMCIAMTLVFDRIYSEVIPDHQGLERVREAGRKAPLVLLPCHRSHIDYLVVSYLFYVNGLIPPHIAAGKNLNFFPLGAIFRRCGAFFIRRSFKHNEVYSLSFREYLRKLIKDGYWTEFFIEGGRSRTGKTLPPKFGMLRTIIESIRSGAAPDAYLVPIYIGYEQVIEERAYTREIGGGEKKRENITSLLRTTRVLWSRYGRLYVNFAEPISCRQLLEREELLDSDPSPERMQHFVRRAAYTVLEGINQAAIITPSALTAMALLSHRRRGLPRRKLLARVGLLLEVASLKKAPLSKTVEHSLKLHRQEVANAVAELEDQGQRYHSFALGDESVAAIARGHAVSEAIDESLARFIKEKYLVTHRFEEDESEEVVYTLKAQRRINLDIYKNNIVHLLVLESILAVAVRRCRRERGAKLAEVREAAEYLSRLLKLEFVYNPSRSFTEQFARTLSQFEVQAMITVHSPNAPNPNDSEVPVEAHHGEPTAGLLQTDGAINDNLLLRVPPFAEGTLSLLHHVLEPWLEAYWLVATGLEQLLEHAMPKKELIRRIQRMSKRLYQEGIITCPESANSVTFNNAIQIFSEKGLVRSYRRGRDVLLELGPRAASHPDELRETSARIRSFFDN